MIIIISFISGAHSRMTGWRRRHATGHAAAGACVCNVHAVHEWDAREFRWRCGHVGSLRGHEQKSRRYFKLWRVLHHDRRDAAHLTEKSPRSRTLYMLSRSLHYRQWQEDNVLPHPHTKLQNFPVISTDTAVVAIRIPAVSFTVSLSTFDIYTNRQLRSPFTNGGGNVSDVRPNLFLIGGGTNPANTKAKCPSEAWSAGAPRGRQRHAKYHVNHSTVHG